MEWVFRLVCGLVGHTDTIKLQSTKRRRLHDQYGLPTGFAIVIKAEYVVCKRCGTRFYQIGGEAMTVVKEKT